MPTENLKLRIVLKVLKIVYSKDVFSRVSTLYSKAKTIKLYPMGYDTFR